MDSNPTEVTSSTKVEGTKTKVEGQPKTVQDEELFQASTKGLQIDVSLSGSTNMYTEEGGFEDCTNQDADEIDKWETIEGDNIDFDDSDDDLL